MRQPDSSMTRESIYYQSYRFGNIVIYVDKKKPDYSEGFGPTKISLNWSALGDTSIEDSEKFCKDMQDAIKFAKTLK